MDYFANRSNIRAADSSQFEAFMRIAGSIAGDADYQNNVPVPARYYAIMIGTVASGLGLIRLAQALRLLLLIYGEA